jgi:hypothetical protein
MWIVLQRVDPLLCKDNETNNDTTLAARQQILKKPQLNYSSEKRCFLSGPWWDVITRKAWNNSSAVGYSPDSNHVNTEAEEYQWLRSITGKRLVIVDWEGLVSAVMICTSKMWRLAMALYVLVVTSWVYKWSINPISNSNAVYIHTPSRDSTKVNDKYSTRV